MESSLLAGATAHADTAPRGRPRRFDPEVALAAALRVFWTRGYEGASLTELTEAMGITRPSLYACFGNKEALFHRALDLYERDKLAYVRRSLDAPTARGVAERWLSGVLALHVDDANPEGCLGVIAAVACAAEAESIKAEVVRRRASSEAALVERLHRACAEGDLPDGYDPAAVAHYLLAVSHGLSLRAGCASSREELHSIVEVAMALWPSA